MCNTRHINFATTVFIILIPFWRIIFCLLENYIFFAWLKFNSFGRPRCLWHSRAPQNFALTDGSVLLILSINQINTQNNKIQPKTFHVLNVVEFRNLTTNNNCEIWKVKPCTPGHLQWSPLIFVTVAIETFLANI